MTPRYDHEVVNEHSEMTLEALIKTVLENRLGPHLDERRLEDASQRVYLEVRGWIMDLAEGIEQYDNGYRDAENTWNQNKQ